MESVPEQSRSGTWESSRRMKEVPGNDRSEFSGIGS